MPEYLPPGTFLYGVVMQDPEEKPPQEGSLPSPEEMREMCRKVEVNCPGCGVTLDIKPVDIVYCPCCDRAFERETGRIVSESEADRQKREGLDG